MDDCVRGTPNIETCIIISGGHLVGDTCIKTLLWTVLRFVCRGRRCVSLNFSLFLFFSLVLLGYGHRLELSFAVLKSDNVPTQWVKFSFTFWIKSFLFYFPALRSRRKGRRESKSLIVLHRARGNFGKIRTRGVCWCCCCCCCCWFCCNFVVIFCYYSPQPSWKLHQDKNLRGSLATVVGVVFIVVAVIFVIVDVVVVVAIVVFGVIILFVIFAVLFITAPVETWVR